MKHTVLIVLILLVSTAVAQEDHRMELAAYVGRDVRKMDADGRQAFVSLFRSVSGDDKALSEDDWEFVPQRLYEFVDPEARFFVEISPGFDRPSFCGLRVHFFDDDWKPIRTDSFSTGYRQEITDVYKYCPKEFGSDVLAVKTISAGPWEVTRTGKRIGTPFFAGEHQLQFYAVIDGGLMLVRREDEKARLILNDYSNWSVPEIGMNYPKGTTNELLDILRSGADPERLALLAWTAGQHMSSEKERAEGVNQEPVGSSRAYEDLLNAPEFNGIVSDLRKANNKWVREYAAKIGEP